jgi:dihydroflavonol-4-reductase
MTFIDVRICKCADANMQIVLICKSADMKMCIFLFAQPVCTSANYQINKSFAHLHICTSAHQSAHLHPHICTFKMILVTGATGFLGSELACQLVQQGNIIRCTKRGSSTIPPLLVPLSQQIQWVDADIMDIFALEAALDGVTQVYHCAAWVSLRQADKGPMIRTNITGTANLVNLCLDRTARLVHVSSIAAIGTALAGELITENHHLEETAANDGYAISKLESEMEVWRGIAEGLDAVIVNPSLIIGPNAGTEGTGQLFENVRKGLKFYTKGAGGFVDVGDVAKCMIALMNSDIQGERYIISAENRSYQDITAAIANCFGTKAPATLAKPWMMEIAWRAAALAGALTGKAPAIDKVAAQTASLTREYDNTKIRKAIGIEFKPVDETVREVCERLRS